MPRVRSARPDEDAEIAILDSALFPYAGLVPRQVAYFRRKAPDLVLVAPEPGWGVAGFLVGSVVRYGRVATLHVVSMGVVRHLRRRGLGRRLLEAAVRRARRHGAARARLEVWTGNRPAIGLYRSLGFGEAGRKPDYYERGRDALVLQRPLSRRRRTGS